MPFGFQRLNERQQRPNQNIVFIKPLDGADKEISQDFLERIAAICAPITKTNHLFVASLEEFPPNREFWGRNFNAGECIQLVLKSPTNGRWLPFRFVQMVMMHELAHCQQMNHSRNFWKARNKFADELRELWSKGYTGDGLFGRGQSLYSGQYTEDAAPDLGDSPEHLCGGVYRSGRGKRGRRGGANTSQLTYAEKKQRRIEKKFGKGGESLGGDEEGRVKLENGKKAKGKPRVAGSVRGRELRAAAALARFDKSAKNDQADDDETASEDDYDEPAIKIEAVDGNGNKILNEKGNSFVKVCGDEDVEDDDGARQEMEELGSFSQSRIPEPKQNKRVVTTIDKRNSKAKGKLTVNSAPKQPALAVEETSTKTQVPRFKKIYDDDESTASEAEDIIPVPKKPSVMIDDEETASEAEVEDNNEKKSQAGFEGGAAREMDEAKYTSLTLNDRKPAGLRNNVSETSNSKGSAKSEDEKRLSSYAAPAPAPAAVSVNDIPPADDDADVDAATTAVTAAPVKDTLATAPVPGVCPVCSLENDTDALRCAACSHVLAPTSLPGCWPCRTANCKDLGYLNVGDNGICGLCGAPKA